MTVLEFNNIGLKFGDSVILDDVSFEVKQGEIFGLVGHNGAGKTSLIKILLGLTARYLGNIKILSSSDLNTMRGYIGEVLDSTSFDTSLSAAQYLDRMSRLFNTYNKDNNRNILESVGLSDTGKKRISKFSLGMKRRLMIAGALVGDPKILVLDEPFNGIDPNGMADMRMMLMKLASKGVTILVTSHIISELIKFASSYAVICKGKFIDHIDGKQLSKIKKVKTIFKTDDPGALSSELDKIYSHYDQAADKLGEIAIFADLSAEECNAARALCPELINDIAKENMNEEEILIWKMNGAHQ